MGVIRKKTANRGGEGGVKYVCDVCSVDITSTVSLLLRDSREYRDAGFATMPVQELTVYCTYRSVLDVQTRPVQISISASRALRKASLATPTTPRHIPSE